MKMIKQTSLKNSSSASAAASSASSSNPGSKPVSTIMTKHFAVVRESLDVERLTKFLLERNLTCAAVSDDDGTLRGYVSMIDLVRERYINGDTENDLGERGRADALAHMKHDFNGELRSGFHLATTPRATVKDIMMPFVFRLPEDAPIDQAAALMAAESVHRVLIVDSLNKVVGIVSALDVLAWIATRDGYAIPDATRARWRSSCEYATT